MTNQPSLRALLVMRVLLPLALTWLLGTALTVAVSLFFAQKAFDRGLVDDAYTIASRVSLHPEGLTLDLTTGEMGAVLFDKTENVFFSVQRRDGSVLAGHPWLRAPVSVVRTSLGLVDQRVSFSDSIYQGKDLRVVSLSLSEPEPFTVLVGQTRGSRNQMLEAVLMYSIVPQMILLGVLAWWLRREIGSQLQPLSKLEQSINERDALDLTPVPISDANRDMALLGAAINDLLTRLERSLRAQREFSGNVAHELRTPLAGIRALAEYGLAHQDPIVWRDQLHRIVSSEARADRLVEQLLALALAEETQTGIPVEPVRLDEVVRERVLRFMPRADAERVDLGVQGLDDPITIFANMALVEGALGNLIDNALRYGLSAHGVSRVTVGVQQSSSSVDLTVTDNGAGLSLQERQHLMQRGVRGLHAERLGQGAGLGLAIVSKFAQVMHARFELSPGPEGQGLCATLSFKRDPRAS